MKGEWMPNLARRILDGSVTFSEAAFFVIWRILRMREQVTMEGITFEGMDRTLWGLIAQIIVNREYSPSGFEIGAEDVVIDVGAHKGVFVGFAANRTKGQVLAIEPDSQNLTSLGRLVETNGFGNVRIVKAAVSDREGTTRIYRATSDSRHSLLGVDQRTGDRLRESSEVSTISLDQVLDPYAVVHLLKVDCEGSEYMIFDSVKLETLTKVRRIAMEVHRSTNAELLDTMLRRISLRFRSVSLQWRSPSLGVLFAHNSEPSSKFLRLS